MCRRLLQQWCSGFKLALYPIFNRCLLFCIICMFTAKFAAYSCLCTKKILVLCRSICSPCHYPNSSPLFIHESPTIHLFVTLEVPIEHLHEDFLPIAFQHISMARNHGVKIPLSDLSHAIVEAVTVLGEQIPVEAL
jgi:hypothetical protein